MDSDGDQFYAKTRSSKKKKPSSVIQGGIAKVKNKKARAAVPKGFKKRCHRVIGTKREVYNGVAHHTVGGVRKEGLVQTSRGLKYRAMQAAAKRQIAKGTSKFAKNAARLKRGA
jgi:hypothetical protein